MNQQFRHMAGYTHDKVGSNPDAWIGKAENLNAAANILYASYKEKKLRSLDVCFLNAGLSIELILKAICTKKNIAFPKSHKLVDLARHAGVIFSPDQDKTLKLLGEFIIWVGRYPVPLKEGDWDDYQDNIFPMVTKTSVTSIGTATKGENVKNEKIFPSLENYNSIWTYCLECFEGVR